MTRKPSTATELRSVKADLKYVSDRLIELRNELMILRTRTNKAEAEAAEWKRLFDALLARTPVIADPASVMTVTGPGVFRPATS